MALIAGYQFYVSTVAPPGAPPWRRTRGSRHDREDRTLHGQNRPLCAPCGLYPRLTANPGLVPLNSTSLALSPSPRALHPQPPSVPPEQWSGALTGDLTAASSATTTSGPAPLA